MGGPKQIFLIILLLCFSALSSTVFADSSMELEIDCTVLCADAAASEKADPPEDKWDRVEDCFGANRNDADTYIAVATCAYNNYADSTAEKYAVKSANAKFAWISFLRKIPGVNRVWKTGGIGETYTLAYMASGGLRHQDKAIGYLKTSGQCLKADDADACAENYFENVVTRYELRDIKAARISIPIPNRLALTGKIYDSEGDPIKYAKINFICGTKEYVNTTDSNGNYRILLPPKLSVTDACATGKLYVKLEYHDPQNFTKIYSRIIYNREPVWFMKKIQFRGPEDLRQDFEIKRGLTTAQYDGSLNPRFAYHLATMYKHMVEVIDFYRINLKVNIDYKLPVDVYAFTSGDNTYYSPENSDIVISRSDSAITSSDKPMNREWHEFNHHAMFSMYRKWPTVPGSSVSSVNHDGFTNPSTSDSYVEGYAEFMSMVLADVMNKSHPEVYAGFGSLEVDYTPYVNRGYDEEFAVAGVLWDLYDPKNDDKVDLTLNQIFNTLRPYRKDFTEVHKAFVEKFPGFKTEIDEIFIKHGFYVETDAGDGNWTANEPYRDANNNRAYNRGEYFIDYAKNISWQTGETVGPAADKMRPTRTNAGKTPGHFIKVDNNYPTYKVKVEFTQKTQWNYETLTENKDGLVYVHVPGEVYTSRITVTPEGVTGTPLSFYSTDFYEAMPEIIEQGYYIEHDFGISDIEEDIPEAQNFDENPYWEEFDMEITDTDFIYISPEEGGKFPWLITLVAILIVAGLYLIFKNKPKKKKRHLKIF